MHCCLRTHCPTALLVRWESECAELVERLAFCKHMCKGSWLQACQVLM